MSTYNWMTTLMTSWLGIPIFGSDFWDPHWKQNSDSVFDSGDSGWIFFLNSAVEKSTNQNSDSKIWNFEEKLTKVFNTPHFT
jgi:hypothetical protein